MTNPQIRQAEAIMLTTYLHTIPYPERRVFITRVTDSASLPRRHFYNWQYALARIPTHVKRIIEEEAHQPIFTWSSEFL